MCPVVASLAEKSRVGDRLGTFLAVCVFVRAANTKAITCCILLEFGEDLLEVVAVSTIISLSSLHVDRAYMTLVVLARLPICHILECNFP